MLLNELGRRFEIVLVGPKPFPWCRYTHCAVTRSLDLLAKHNFQPSDVAEVRVHIGERDMRSVGGWTQEEKQKKLRPESVVDAQFSIPFTVAATLLNGGLSLEDFTEAKLGGQEVLDLAARVELVLKPELDDGPMDVKPQIIEIMTRSGTIYRERVVYPEGNPNNPVTSEKLIAAFRGMASYAAKQLGSDKIDEAVSTTLRLEESKDVAALTTLLTA